MGFFNSCWPFGQPLYKLDIAALLNKTEEAVEIGQQAATAAESAVTAANLSATSAQNSMTLAGQAQVQAQAAQTAADQSAAAAIAAQNEIARIAASKLDLPTSGTWTPRLADRTTGQDITASSAIIYDAATIGRWYKIGSLVFVDVEIIIGSSTVEVYLPAGVRLPFPAINSLAPLARGIGYNIITDRPGGYAAENVDAWAVTGNMAIPYIGQTGAYWNPNPSVTTRVCFSGCYITNQEEPSL